MRFGLLIIIAAQAHATPSLVQTFCTELVLGAQQGLEVERSDSAWRNFVTTLEKLQVRAPVEDTALQHCILDNRDDMEKGEFLLQGRQALRRLSAQEQQAVVRDPVADAVLGSATLPGFGEVPLPNTTRRGDERSEARTAQRIERYGELWKSFVSDLRKTMTVRRQTLKMKLSGS